MKKLNLGCGNDIKKDYVNLDIAKLQGVNVVWDVNKLPLTTDRRGLTDVGLFIFDNNKLFFI